MNLPAPTKSVVLAVLDGWGLAAPGAGNAISQANTVNMNRFLAGYPHTSLAAAGEAVGLPRGEAGNTEMGHLNLGAGRIVYGDLARINMSIAEGSFFKNEAFLAAIEHAKKHNSKLHLMGLIGALGVHSNIDHLFALIHLAREHDFSNLFIHVFTDGRDSPPTSANTYITKLRDVLKKEGVGQIASVMGRYWAMDRDLRWERTEKAYLALTQGKGNLIKTPEEAIEASYAQGVTDEFVEPSIVTTPDGKPVARVEENDAVIFYNFRIDRPRELSKAFVLEDFSRANASESFDPYMVKYEKKHLPIEARAVTSPFVRGLRIPNLCFVMMTEYSKVLVENGAKVAYPPEPVGVTLGTVLSENGKRQLRLAESEKERFVTYYFSGLKENPFDGEDRIILPSPKVATYDLKPEMSAREITEQLLTELKKSVYAFVLVNFANVDMVGHTGNIGAAVSACEVVDECIGKLADYITAYDGTLIITGDHGNTEEMIDHQSGQIETEHSTNDVPFILINKELTGKPQTLGTGILADVAPTILGLLGVTVPSSMTGRNLLP